jgi:hypothetical protein
LQLEDEGSDITGDLRTGLVEPVLDTISLSHASVAVLEKANICDVPVDELTIEKFSPNEVEWRTIAKAFRPQYCAINVSKVDLSGLLTFTTQEGIHELSLFGDSQLSPSVRDSLGGLLSRSSHMHSLSCQEYIPSEIVAASISKMRLRYLSIFDCLGSELSADAAFLHPTVEELHVSVGGMELIPKYVWGQGKLEHASVNSLTGGNGLGHLSGYAGLKTLRVNGVTMNSMDALKLSLLPHLESVTFTSDVSASNLLTLFRSKSLRRVSVKSVKFAEGVTAERLPDCKGEIEIEDSLAKEEIVRLREYLPQAAIIVQGRSS